MSEKALLDYVDHKLHCDIQVYGGRVFEGMSVYCNCGLDQVLSEQTDLEQLKEWLCQRSEEEWVRDSPDNPSISGAEAFDEAIQYIVDEFEMSAARRAGC